MTVRSLRIVLLSSLIVSSCHGTINVVKDILHQRQEQTHWCWAACGQMVLEHIYPALSFQQGSIVDTSFSGVRNCYDPQNASDSLCNQGGYVNWGMYNVGCVKTVYGPVSWDTLVNEVASNRPVVFQWQWTHDPGSHFMVAVASYQIMEEDSLVVVFDPMRRFPRIMTYAFYKASPDHYDINDWYHLQADTL